MGLREDVGLALGGLPLDGLRALPGMLRSYVTGDGDPPSMKFISVVVVVYSILSKWICNLLNLWEKKKNITHCITKTIAGCVISKPYYQYTVILTYNSHYYHLI